jgi:hypothetical protein
MGRRYLLFGNDRERFATGKDTGREAGFSTPLRSGRNDGFGWAGEEEAAKDRFIFN